MINEDHDRSALRVVIAPDSFKGSASALEAAEAIQTGLRSAWANISPAPQTTLLPFADGGEGTLDAIISAWGARVETVATTDAIGRPAVARYGVSPDGRIGIVEAAGANGLPQISDVTMRPLEATSYGVGAIIAALLDAGVAELILFIGGSASSDGGVGILEALGARIMDADGVPLPRGGGSLVDLHTIDLSGVDERARAVRWRIACDVTNPLIGPKGAAAVFGPQKGADADDIAAIESGLVRLAEVLQRETGVDTSTVPGTGAAGGIAAPLVALFGALLEPGWQVVADAVDARDVLAAADLVITGEGRLDTQSLDGKVVSGIRALTPPHVPVVVIAGEVTLSSTDMDAAGITAAFSLAPGPRTLEELRHRAAAEIARTAHAVGRLFLSATPHGKGANR